MSANSAVRCRRLGEANRTLLAMCGGRGRWNLGLARAGTHLESRQRAAGRAAEELLACLEAERGRIASDLHDNAGQTLAGIILNLELAARHLGSAQTEALARLRRIQELAEMALEQIRQVSHELYPPQWGEVDFDTAVEWLIDRMALRARVEVDVTEFQPPKDLPPAVKTVLYRALQEGLTNILRHARASRVVMRTAVRPQGISLMLEDDGKGFDTGAPRSGIGLASIRRRVESLGGRLRIDSAPGAGTRLTVFLPLAT